MLSYLTSDILSKRSSSDLQYISPFPSKLKKLKTTFAGTTQSKLTPNPQTLQKPKNSIFTLSSWNISLKQILSNYKPTQSQVYKELLWAYYGAAIKAISYSKLTNSVYIGDAVGQLFQLVLNQPCSSIGLKFINHGRILDTVNDMQICSDHKNLFICGNSLDRSTNNSNGGK